jgi:hypothetical protein
MVYAVTKPMLTLLFTVLVASVSSMTDKATGISFRKEINGLSLFGVGVRKVRDVGNLS